MSDVQLDAGIASGVHRQSPLDAKHRALGAKMVPFGGWDMPLSYGGGTVEEHRTCRTDAVVFDVSHLGTVALVGEDVFDRLQSTFTNDLAKIEPGRAQYTHLLDDDGSVADDLIVWWVTPERFDVMPNASNTERVRAAVGGADVTAERAVLAVQGPHARALLGTVFPQAAAVSRFAVERCEWAGAPCVVAGTGYTGEDGVELAVPAEVAASLWDALIGAGIRPAGLGARDTLRLEAALPLHGHELGPGITPLQAKLGWVIGWSKGPFRGREALEAERSTGPARLLRGLVGSTRQPPREGSAVAYDGSRCGTVTSGNFSPMLECGIALALIDTDVEIGLGDIVDVDVRGRLLATTVSRVPFWPPKGAS